MKYPLNLITKTTSGYKAEVHYYTDEGQGYFFGFISAPDFNIPMVWFADGCIFWDECYGDQHLDLGEYNDYLNQREKMIKKMIKKLQDPEFNKKLIEGTDWEKVNQLKKELLGE